MNELALFAGVGGGILGGKLLGWRTVCAVEIDSFCRGMLAPPILESVFGLFPTLRASDATKGGNVTKASIKHKDLRLGGPKNPEWCEWFMGFPIGWTALEPLKMRKFRQWLNSHLKR